MARTPRNQDPAELSAVELDTPAPKHTRSSRIKSDGVIKLDNLSVDDLTLHIVGLIGEVARELKIAPNDITWVDFARHAKYAFGHDKYGIIAPRHITRVGGFNNIRDAFFPPSASRIKMEREEIRQRASVHRSVSLTAARDAVVLRQIQEMAQATFKNKIVPSKFALQKHDPNSIERHVNLLCTDWHVRSLLDPREVPLPYGPKEERRRIAAVVADIADWKPQYRENSSLYLHLYGDIIQGALHDLRDGAPRAEQVTAAIWYICHAISYLSTKYHEIHIDCSSGNHGRDTARHKDRAIMQKWDSFETAIYFSCYMASMNLPNVHWHIPYTPYSTWNSFGMQCFGTHGDTVLKPGFPDKDIKTGWVKNQINEINASLVDTREYKLFAVGHVHTASVTHLRNGTTFVTNGALVPPDPFAVSNGILEMQCGQMCWESVPGHIFGDSRFIKVDRHIDKDKSLDKLIPPFPGLPQ